MVQPSSSTPNFPPPDRMSRMRETATRRTRSLLRSPLLLVVLSAVTASASPERSAAVSADQQIVVDSPTDRSQVQRNVAGNVSVQLRLAEDADLSTFAAGEVLNHV